MKRADKRSPQKRKRQVPIYLARLFLAIGSLLITVVVLELACRCFVPERSQRTHTHVFIRPVDGPTRTARVGFVPLSIHRTLYYTDPRGYFGAGAQVDHHFNSAGFRDIEHTLYKPAGIYRILALGDSFLMGQGVHRPDMFLTRIEAALNAARLPVRVEAINTGVSGMNTAHQLELLTTRGLMYDPDLVLVNFTPNDVEDPKYPSQRPVEFYREYAAVTLQRDRISDYSRLWSWMYGTYQKEISGRKYIAECLASFQRDSAKWQRCRDALVGIIRRCRESNVVPMVVIFPFFHELNGDYPFQLIHDRVREVCQAEGAAYFDLRDAFRRYRGPELWVHPTDQHPNEIANGIAAARITEFLLAHRKELQIDHRPPPRYHADDEARLQAVARIIELGGEINNARTEVSFAGVANTDFDFKLLRGYWPALTELAQVNLRGTQAGDATVAALAEQPAIGEIDLSQTQVTARGLPALAKLARLARLELEGVTLDDSAVDAIRGLEQIKKLNLADTRVTDAGLKKLAAMPHLETLNIAGAPVTEDGVLALEKLPGLRELEVSSEQLSESGRRALEVALPGLKIVRRSLAGRAGRT